MLAFRGLESVWTLLSSIVGRVERVGNDMIKIALFPAAYIIVVLL